MNKGRNHEFARVTGLAIESFFVSLAEYRAWQPWIDWLGLRLRLPVSHLGQAAICLTAIAGLRLRWWACCKAPERGLIVVPSESLHSEVLSPETLHRQLNQFNGQRLRPSLPLANWWTDWTANGALHRLEMEFPGERVRRR